MGKFQSKIASKRRQSPEGNINLTTHGGSLACNAQTCQKESKLIHKRKLTEKKQAIKSRRHKNKTYKQVFQDKASKSVKCNTATASKQRALYTGLSKKNSPHLNLCVELRENRLDPNCNCNVGLPPRKPDKGIYIQINKQTKKKGCAVDTERMMAPDDSQQWVFTLCNDSRGKVIKEDMYSLIQSLYEVIEASVMQPGRTPLSIKLAVTPTASPAEKEQSELQTAGNTHRKLYCVDENIERRNHYLDLAGIENYASKFDSAESLSQEPTQNAHAAVQQRMVAERGNCISRGISVPRSLKTKSTSVRNDRNRGGGKPYKHPASWCPLTPSHPPAQSVLHRSHSKRLHCRVQDAVSHLRATPGGDGEILSSRRPCCGVPLVQKHEHHHHHQHHHHHHHHYPASELHSNQR